MRHTYGAAYVAILLPKCHTFTKNFQGRKVLWDTVYLVITGLKCNFSCLIIYNVIIKEVETVNVHKCLANL